MRFFDLENNAECNLARSAAVALGNFDGVHIGHRAIFDALGDAPRAVFTFSDLRREGLICTLGERLSLIRACGVRYAIVAGFAEVRDMSAEAFVRYLCGELGARRLVCGSNFTFGARGAGTPDDLRHLAAESGAEAIVVPPVEIGGAAVSSTRVRELIAAGDMPGAAALLGRNYAFTLPVVHGRELGRTMGYPTVNQLLPAELAAPRYGVYASRCEARGKVREGVTNVGVRPTVDGEALSAETHIFDCDDELYGEEVRVELCEFMRAERRFASVDELFARIAKDADDARRWHAEH